jgi:molybdate transport system substrate-binding protein
LSGSLQKIFLFVVVCLLLIVSPWVQAGSLNVAVASNFVNPAKQLAEKFSHETGHTVNLSSGSTAKLYTQITNGAPFDVFLAATAREPQRLLQVGQAVEGSLITYAVGRLALWSAEPDRVSSDCGATLRQGEYEKLAIANPRVAPYGTQAENVLMSLGVYAGVQSKLVVGENVGQVFRFVATASVPLGLVSLSQVLDPKNPFAGSYCVIDQGLHEPLLQQAVLLNRAENNRAAVEFMGYLQSGAVRTLIKSYGYGLP